VRRRREERNFVKLKRSTPQRGEEPCFKTIFGRGNANSIVVQKGKGKVTTARKAAHKEVPKAIYYKRKKKPIRSRRNLEKHLVKRAIEPEDTIQKKGVETLAIRRICR